MRRAHVVLLFTVGLVACTGEIGDVPPAVSVAAVDVCETAPARGLAFNQLRRLSSTAIINTLGALLGDEIVSDDGIADALVGLPTDATILAGDFIEDPPPVLAQTLRAVAKRATTLALADPVWRAARLPACASVTIADESCAIEAIRDFGSRVMRRDLAESEMESHLELFRAGRGGEAGLALVMRRLLQAPSLVFHIENGTTADDGSIRLTDFEIASRISYLVADTMPDDALLAAARAGQLQSLDGVAAQVRRLLGTPRARAKVRDFFRYYTRLGPDSVQDPVPAHAARLGISSAVGLGHQMYAEALEFFEQIFWDDEVGTFHELMTSTTAHPKSAELARIFGTEGRHVGLLHRPALLASSTERTSPIVRGAHLRKLFLCEELGSPPFELVAERQSVVGDIDNMSNRESVSVLTDSAVCMGCHANINQTGFAFEAFDQLGAPRHEEVIFADDGSVVATWPIDTAIDDAHIADEPTPFAGSEDLVRAVADSEMGRTCLTKRLFQYYRASNLSKADACSVSRADAVTAEGSMQSVLVALIANEDIFWRKEPTE